MFWPPKVEKTTLKSCSEFLKRPKQKNSCSKIWPIDQLYIELGPRHFCLSLFMGMQDRYKSWIIFYLDILNMPENVQHYKIFTFIWTGYCTSVIKVCTLTPKFCTTFTARIASGKKELSHYNNSEQCPSRFLDWMGIPEFSFSALSFAKNFMVPEFHFIVKLPFFLTTSTIRSTAQWGQIIIHNICRFQLIITNFEPLFYASFVTLFVFISI